MTTTATTDTIEIPGTEILGRIFIYRKTGIILRFWCFLVLFWCFYFASGASERHLPFHRRAIQTSAPGGVAAPKTLP
jgi:hypothetical protein